MGSIGINYDEGLKNTPCGKMRKLTCECFSISYGIQIVSLPAHLFNPDYHRIDPEKREFKCREGGEKRISFFVFGSGLVFKIKIVCHKTPGVSKKLALASLSAADERIPARPFHKFWSLRQILCSPEISINSFRGSGMMKYSVGFFCTLMYAAQTKKSLSWEPHLSLIENPWECKIFSHYFFSILLKGKDRFLQINKCISSQASSVDIFEQRRRRESFLPFPTRPISSQSASKSWHPTKFILFKNANREFCGSKMAKLSGRVAMMNAKSHSQYLAMTTFFLLPLEMPASKLITILGCVVERKREKIRRLRLKKRKLELFGRKVVFQWLSCVNVKKKIREKVIIMFNPFLVRRDDIFRTSYIIVDHSHNIEWEDSSLIAM